MIDDVVTAYVTGATTEGYAEEWDLDQLWSSLKQLYPIAITIEDLEEENGGGRENLDAEFILARVKEDAHAAYDRREDELSPDGLRELERRVLLSVIDRKWREHLYEMDYLQEGVGLRAYAQRDPLVEYQREGFDMFSQMLDGVKEEAVRFLFNLEVQVEEAAPATGGEETPAVPRVLPGLTAPRPMPRALQYSAPTIDGEAGSGGVEVVQEAPALGIGGPANRTNGNRSSGNRPNAGGSAANGSANGKTPPGRPAGPSSRTATGGRQAAPGQVVGSGTPSRNSLCYCGSGKKYKRCHGAP